MEDKTLTGPLSHVRKLRVRDLDTHTRTRKFEPTLSAMNRFKTVVVMAPLLRASAAHLRDRSQILFVRPYTPLFTVMLGRGTTSTM